MKKTVPSTLSGIAAGLVSSGLLAALSGSPITRTQWLLVIGLSVAAFIVSWVLQKGPAPGRPAGEQIASSIRSEGDVVVKDITVSAAGSADLQVASALKGGGNVTVSGIQVLHPPTDRP